MHIQCSLFYLSFSNSDDHEILTIFFVAGKQVVIALKVGPAIELVGRFADQHLLDIVNAIDDHCRLIAELQTDDRTEFFAEYAE